MKNNKIYTCLFFSFFILSSCSENKSANETTTDKEPAFCDCVNKDYHNKGDKEKCEKIESDLKEKLKTVSKDEKGDILMQIQDCKVAGQYDND